MAVLTITSLTADLLSAALDLDRQCFGGLWTLDGYQRELDSPNSDLLIFLASPSPSSSPSAHPLIVGLGCSWSIVDEAHITLVGIYPQYQRQGLGQAMLIALLQAAQIRGLKRSTLEVRASNQSAIDLYNKFGFQEAGRRRRYYQDTGEDALVLWRSGLQSPSFPSTLTTWHQETSDRLTAHDWQLTFDQEYFRSLLAYRLEDALVAPLLPEA
ncbi:ribosomal protein S18-alanine N-acetyltransferase [Pantanalinema sp. GBBB05]|uniref:ribosomal protein S18-alanine N-acetyltransferase n=1 Tax=Pantanalinema sp. GBBB05 TaxID=2604139 RepID=UPI001DB2401C|nr:ribosomal-protein-alanine N-acetyltransferase [Pantanalinema sp. GBBB05]